jgi:hypothetical protein
MTIPSASDVIKLVKAGLTIEAQEKIMEMRLAALEFQEENLTLKARVKELEAELHQKKSLKHDRMFYWLEGDQVPYCPHCYETEQKLIHLFSVRYLNNKNEHFQCNTCYHDFSAEPGKPFFSGINARRRHDATKKY